MKVYYDWLFLFLTLMSVENVSVVKVERHLLQSEHLSREVILDCYIPANIKVMEGINLLLVNDGQDLVKMVFEDILENLLQEASIEPLFCVGIHCSSDRKNEYGTANILDY